MSLFPSAIFHHHVRIVFISLFFLCSCFCSLLIKQCVSRESLSHLYSSTSLLFLYIFPLHLLHCVSQCFSYVVGVQCSLNRAIKALERFQQNAAVNSERKQLFLCSIPKCSGEQRLPRTPQETERFAFTAACSAAALHV